MGVGTGCAYRIKAQNVRIYLNPLDIRIEGEEKEVNRIGFVLFENAVREENFELAAKLRDEIRGLEG